MSYWDSIQAGAGSVWDSVSDGAETVFDYMLDQEVEGVISADDATEAGKTSMPGGSDISPSESGGLNWQLIGVGIAAVSLLFTVIMARR